MSQQIAQTKFHQQGREITVLTQDNTIDPHLTITIEIGTITMIIETDIGLTGRDPIPTIIDTGVTVAVIHKGVAPGHITDPHTAALHTTETQAHITTDETPYTEEPHHTGVLPGITVDPDHVCHTNKTPKHHPNHLTALNGQSGEAEKEI